MADHDYATTRNPLATCGSTHKGPSGMELWYVFFVDTLSKLVNERPSCRWHETPWYPWDVIVMRYAVTSRIWHIRISKQGLSNILVVTRICDPVMDRIWYMMISNFDRKSYFNKHIPLGVWWLFRTFAFLSATFNSHTVFAKFEFEYKVSLGKGDIKMLSAKYLSFLSGINTST